MTFLTLLIMSYWHLNTNRCMV